MKHTAQSLTSQVFKNIDNVDVRLIDEFDHLIDSSEKIFITGAGRSALVGKFFGMRLMHMGKNVYIVGETCTPRIDKNSILLAISCSGETSSVVTICNTAKQNKAKIVLFTSCKACTLSILSDFVIRIGVNMENKHNGINVMPMGTLFEITTLILLETFIGEFIFKHKITENELKSRHTNLE